MHFHSLGVDGRTDGRGAEFFSSSAAAAAYSLMQNWHINLANFFTSTNGIRERDWWPYFKRTQVICSVPGLARLQSILCRYLVFWLIRHRGQPLILLLRAILIYQCKKGRNLLIRKVSSSVVFHTFRISTCASTSRDWDAAAAGFCFLPSSLMQALRPTFSIQ